VATLNHGTLAHVMAIMITLKFSGLSYHVSFMCTLSSLYTPIENLVCLLSSYTELPGNITEVSNTANIKDCH
jgi:hypothetical protein